MKWFTSITSQSKLVRIKLNFILALNIRNIKIVHIEKDSRISI